MNADLTSRSECDATGAAFTPGPWEAYTDCPGACCWLIRQVGTEDEPGEGVTWPETGEADARLIAAAPDMLAVLQTIVRVADGRTIPGNLIVDENSPIMGAARDAIAKATGAAQ